VLPRTVVYMIYAAAIFLMPRCVGATTSPTARARFLITSEPGNATEAALRRLRSFRDRIGDGHRAPRHFGVQALDHAAVDLQHALVFILW
jgi:hypothetical protein